MMNMHLLFYPTDCLQDLGADFAGCIGRTAQAKKALVGPVVLAAMASAVQGVVDIYTPSHQVMPTSLYVAAIAASGMRKSTVVRYAFHGFSDFELGFDGRISGDVDFSQTGCHPYIWEDASESGMLSLFRNGAKAAAMVMDEGGMLETRLDNQAMCKRFDGSPLRVIRHHQITQIRNIRTVFCMTIQDDVFNNLLKGKQGAMMVSSGLMPRMLISYATNSPPHISLNHSYENPNEHRFHERVRELMVDYGNKLKNSAERDQIRMSPEAENVWHCANNRWTALPNFNETWRGMDAFVHRAGEHALRIAAVLQWFTDPQPFIQRSYMESAVRLVDWHLNQALMGFGTPSEEAQQVKLGKELYGYIMKKWNTVRQSNFSRKDLLRKGPATVRKALNLDLAIDQLLLEDKVVGFPSGERKQLILNMTQKPSISLLSMQTVPIIKTDGLSNFPY